MKTYNTKENTENKNFIVENKERKLFLLSPLLYVKSHSTDSILLAHCNSRFKYKLSNHITDLYTPSNLYKLKLVYLATL